MTFWKERRAPNSLQRPHDQREEFERDRARVIHSSAFRRLQAKTQILGVLEGDFHRTRLTHSMEVAQIGRGLVLNLANRYPQQKDLLPTLEQIETNGLAHDLGHPPFGHGGEIALNYLMSGFGGFEANGQTLRILSSLESHTPEYGLDLTRRSLLGILKYPVPYSRLCRKKLPEENGSDNESILVQDWNPPKCYLDTEEKVLDWVFLHLTDADRELFCEQSIPTDHNHGFSLYKALDTSMMNLADDIAYGVHDLEDGIVLRLLNLDHWKIAVKNVDQKWAADKNLLDIENQLFNSGEDSGHGRKQAVGALVHGLVSSVELVKNENFEEPLLQWNAVLPQEPNNFLKSLQETVWHNMIQLNTVQASTYKGRKIVLSIFEALSSDPEMLLPRSFQSLWKSAKSEQGQKRIICDYIAGMTDQYANRFYQRLFLPGHGSVFDRL